MSTRAIQDGMMLLGYRDPTTDEWLAGGSVEFYAAGTLNAKNAWEDKDKASAITSVTLDSSGQAQVYFDGVYKFIVKDSAGTTKYTFDNLKFQARNTSTVSKTANYTATVDDDYILCNTDIGAFTITLPAVAGVVAPITIKNVGSSGNNVTVDGDVAETIDGSATQTIADSQSQQYVTDGVQWYGSGIGAGTSGILIDVQIFTSSGTWTKPANANSVEVFCNGGGGGGGGVSGTYRAAGGGGSGAEVYSYLTSGFGASETVTVGAGGAGGAATGANGASGGNSSFGSLVVAAGGNFGTAGDGTQTTSRITDGAGGLGGEFGSCTGQIIKPGIAGNDGIFVNTVWLQGGNGGGNNSPSGSLIWGAALSVTGAGSSGPSSKGGSGAVASNSAIGKAGGSGSDGLVIVKSYT